MTIWLFDIEDRMETKNHKVLKKKINLRCKNIFNTFN